MDEQRTEKSESIHYPVLKIGQTSQKTRNWAVGGHAPCSRFNSLSLCRNVVLGAPTCAPTESVSVSNQVYDTCLARLATNLGLSSLALRASQLELGLDLENWVAEGDEEMAGCVAGSR